MTDTLRFVLDGEIVAINKPSPTRTVLQYLREDIARSGTKEGCAEGDCGACTVVLGELNAAGGLTHTAVNACIQFLPSLHGKALLTVESISAPEEPLHPVQQAMVDCHGSQCGFCTPGFVMSLYAHYQEDGGSDRETINAALSGNLCRCTGYRPILEAASRMYDYPQPADDLQQITIEALKTLQMDPPLHVESDGAIYSAPRSIEDLAKAVQQYPEATIVAGTTDTGLWVTKQYRELPTLISTMSVPALQTIESLDDELVIGSAVTLSQALPVLNQHFPELKELWERFASTPIRNTATLGGNIANGSPIGDSMPALLALDASVTLRRGAETRQLPLQEFYLGYQHTALAEAEFIEHIRIPKKQDNQHIAAYKLSKRFDQDISAVCAGFSTMLDNDDHIRDIRIGFGGMAAIPSRASHCERYLEGLHVPSINTDQVADELSKDFSPITDMRASDAYRRSMAQTLVCKFLEQLQSPTGVTQVMSIYHYG